MQLMFDNKKVSLSEYSTINSTTSDTGNKVEVIVISGKRHLTGGCSDEFSDPLYLVDIQDGSARKLPAFPYECKIKSITVHEKSIYVNGKVSSNRYGNPLRNLRRPVFRFNLESNSWETMVERSGPPLTEYVFQVGKWLYLSWIQSMDFFTITNLSRYDLERNEFSNWTDDTIRYRHPAFVCIDTMIYAIGGCLIMEDDVAVSTAQEEDEFALPSRPRALVTTVQRLNAETGEWTLLAPLIEPKEEFLCAAYNEKIYVLDGHDRPIRMCPQVYDIVENRWEWGPALNRVYSLPATLVVLNGILTFIDKSRFPLLYVERLCPESNSWVIAEDVEVKSEFQILNAQFFPGVAKFRVS